MSNTTQFHVTILTEQRYVDPKEIDIYTQNVLDEDRFIQKALEERGLKVFRTNWDNPDFDWTSTEHILFRTIWDYFDRFNEFSPWLEKVSKQTKLINPKDLIYWNIDKHYLQDLASNGVQIPNTVFIEQGDQRTLKTIVSDTNWEEFILKPVISGAARHTYRFTAKECEKHASVFSELIENESMMLQEFQKNIVSKGEVSFSISSLKTEACFSHSLAVKR